MTEEAASPLDPEAAAAFYAAHEASLRRFLWGVLRDASLVQDVLQAAFIKLLERGGEAQEETRKAWLFRVAYHEALAIRRRQAVGERAAEKLSRTAPDAAPSPESPLVRQETVEQVRAAIKALPPAQRQIVEMRVYEQKTFAVIAAELEIPLGTALGRMRAAIGKLRARLGDDDQA